MSDREVRKHLTELLNGGQAHITFRDAIADFPVDKAGIRPSGSPHSAWELLEHIRIAQRDITLFSGVLEDSVPKGHPKGYEPLKWPDDYWPKTPAPPNPDDWQKSVAAIEEDLAAFLNLIESPERPLFEPFPWGDGQTLFREALLIADHNSYHLGQLLLVRKMVE